MINEKDNQISDNSMLYFGSHNFSPSAWGNIEKKDTQISIANWELGIVFPPSPDSAKLKKEIMSQMTINMTNPQKYEKGDDQPFILSKQV